MKTLDPDSMLDPEGASPPLPPPCGEGKGGSGSGSGAVAERSAPSSVSLHPEPPRPLTPPRKGEGNIGGGSGARNLDDGQSSVGPDVTSGTLHGVGLGPGDPELMTVRAARLISEAKVIAWFAKKGRKGNARTILDGLIPEAAEQIALEYPITTEAHFAGEDYVSTLSGFYAEAAAGLAARLASGLDVVLVSEGDPFFYGSFMHLYVRLKDRFQVSVTPGVTGMSACWTASGKPITWGDDVLSVLPATLPEDELARRLRDADAAVVMKLGGNCAKVRRAFAAAGKLDRAIYAERGSMAKQVIEPFATRTDDDAPYFSMILLPGRGRRP